MRIMTRGGRGLLAVGWVACWFLLSPGMARAQTFSGATLPLDPGKQLDPAEPAAWGDYDNDGYVDIISKGVVWRNIAGTDFIDVHHLGMGGYSIWGDYDNDGWLDIVHWSGGELSLFHNEGGSDFIQVALPELPLTQTRGSAWGDWDKDGDIDLYVGGYEIRVRKGHPDVILRNDQESGFTQIWEEENPPGWEQIKSGRGITACDFDQDGDLDIHVSNYRTEENFLWLNDGLGAFTDVATEYGVNDWADPDVQSPGETIGSAWADLDNDGYFDLFEGNFSHYLITKQPSFYRNLGPAGLYHFEDMTLLVSLPWKESYATPAFGDYDNDGDLDLYYTTVYFDPDPSNPNPDRPRLYRNDGNWQFTDVTDQEGLGALEATTQAAWADMDRDGDLDLVTHGKIFVNAGNSNRWLKVKLIGEDGIGNVIGSQVRIVDAYGGWTGLARQVEAGMGEANQNDMTLHFGLGPGPLTTVNIEVLWPDRSTSYVLDADVMNQEIIIQKGLPWGRAPHWPPEYR